MTDGKPTTLQVTKETIDRVNDLKREGDTSANEVVERLLNYRERTLKDTEALLAPGESVEAAIERLNNHHEEPESDGS